MYFYEHLVERFQGNCFRRLVPSFSTEITNYCSFFLFFNDDMCRQSCFHMFVVGLISFLCYKYEGTEHLNFSCYLLYFYQETFFQFDRHIKHYNVDLIILNNILRNFYLMWELNLQF